MEGEESARCGGNSSEAADEVKVLSKNQLKKLQKRERWMETKQERRKFEKQKKKQRLIEKKERGEDVGRSRKSLKLNSMKNSACKIRVVLDLSLDGYMADKDITSLTSQIQHCYSSNRRAENPMQVYACSLGGRTQQRLDSIGDYKGWDIHFKEESYMDVFPKESIVYLSAESSNMLTSLSEDKVYVIGGLVDHNSQKGLCHRLAEENGITHAQLPISEFFHLKGRKVLAVNHVFSILLRYTELGDWKQAFLAELPTRKGFSPVFDESNPLADDVKETESPTIEKDGLKTSSTTSSPASVEEKEGSENSDERKSGDQQVESNQCQKESIPQSQSGMAAGYDGKDVMDSECKARDVIQAKHNDNSDIGDGAGNQVDIS